MSFLRGWAGWSAMGIAILIAGCGLSHPSTLTGDGATDAHFDATGDHTDGGGLDADSAVCPSGMTNCSGVCVTTADDPNNCGACGRPCATGQACVLGLCQMSCTGATPTLCGNTCVNLTSDSFHCGACTTVCSGGQTCMAGSCTCPAGQTICNGQCVNEQTDPNHCGGCNTVCPTGMNCSAGACSLTCPTGDSVCSGGCVNEQTDPQHCGDCGTVCAPQHVIGGATCASGQCSYTSCAPGFADCDGDRRNGCEVDTSGDPTHCGSCTMNCPGGGHGVPACTSGTCGLTCVAGYADCDGNAANGCEVNTTTDVNNCNGCHVACPSGVHSSATCSASTCGITCSSTHYADCDGLASTGCEVDVRSDPNHCSGCGVACPSGSNSSPTCVSSVCGINCTPGFQDCDGTASTGCESMAATDPNNCGGCGTVCNSFHAGNNLCVAGTCTYTSCATGYADCIPATAGCETPLGTNMNCASCGNACGVGQTCGPAPLGCH